MKYLTILSLISLFISCNPIIDDSTQLTTMIENRAIYMQTKNFKEMERQFTDDISWINSQGYLFDGKKDVMLFLNGLTKKKNRGYIYQAGTPKIKIIDRKNAIVNYAWNMLWHKKENITDTIYNEIGLMTLYCVKEKNEWKFTSIVVQHTPYFYDTIEAINMAETVME